MEHRNFVKIPEGLNRGALVEEFGNHAVTHYEKRLSEREEYDGKIYLNPFKTIYIWAMRDRETNSGYYTTVNLSFGNRKRKNYGGS